MAKSKQKRPIGELIDALGDVRIELDALKKIESGLRNEILAQRASEGHGDRWQFAVSSSSRCLLDVARVRAELGEDWVASRSRMTVVSTIRVTPRPIPAGAAIVKAAA
jgi:hypothetical protein